ncbi:cyclase family protein [Candidatus Peregrinibacteria bacterium]|nr:MAG: cyclase family protein [Candidatus Peregrinibacteria bacterium]
MKRIDLTHTFTHDMPVYPGDSQPELIETADDYEGGKIIHYQLKTSMHVGTHMDAPLHMLPNGKRINEYDVDHFFGRGHLIDARGKAIDLDLLEGQSISKGDIVLILTGFSKIFGTPEYYESYPEISETFASKMVELGVHIVGTDTPSPDRSPFAIHKILLGSDILIIENLTHLEALLGQEPFTVTALPVKFDAEAAPVRVVAEI